jgi:hypothetical protein
MDKPHIEKAIKEALDRLLTADFDLLKYDANERSISHRLAVYLEPLFPGWNVDCEYNRDLDDIKRLELPIKKVRTDDLSAKTVYPDIIIHKRGSDNNLLVIEMKKSSNPDKGDSDRTKLQAFKSQLGYTFAVFVCVTVGETPSYAYEFISSNPATPS